MSTDVVSAEKAQQVIDAVNAACELGDMSSTEEAAALTMEALARTVIALHARLDAVTAERDTALDECSSLARSRDYGVEMIDATREALGAADDESAVAAAQRVHRELAVLRAQLAPLLAVHDALVAAAALPGAGASPEAMVEAVRAQGAEAMRAKVLSATVLCTRACETSLKSGTTDERIRALLEVVASAHDLWVDLPIPGAEVSRG